MKNNEIIQFAAFFALAAALLYRRYAKKNKIKDGSGTPISRKSPFSPKSMDDNYEPYSKKKNTDQK